MILRFAYALIGLNVVFDALIVLAFVRMAQTVREIERIRAARQAMRFLQQRGESAMGIALAAELVGRDPRWEQDS